MKQKFFKFSVIILYSVFLFSCNEDAVNTVNTEQNKIISLDKKPGSGDEPEDSIIIGTEGFGCGEHIEYGGWGFSHYQSVSGKFLGIWQNIITRAQCYNKYGFNMIFNNNVSDISDSRNAGFQYDSMMLFLPNYSSAYERITSANNLGYYFIDEPFERSTFSTGTLGNVATMLYEESLNGKLFIASYKWPTLPYNYPYETDTYGDKYNSVLEYASNSYIMCDEYHGNCFGNVDPYWTKFREYYGTNKNISNFMHIIINNGYGNFAGICPGTSNSWYDLLGDANDSGINNLWLFAENTGANELDIRDFCHSAWQRGWLRKFERKISYTIWRCTLSDPCDCNFENPNHGWYISQIVYDNEYREIFP